MIGTGAPPVTTNLAENKLSWLRHIVGSQGLLSYLLTCPRCTGGCLGRAGRAPSQQSQACADTRPCSPCNTDRVLKIFLNSIKSCRLIHDLLYADGALADGVECLGIVVVHEVRRVVVGLRPTVVLKLSSKSAMNSTHFFTLRTQQTPKPLAQAPSAVPPISVHSLVVKQVPLSPVLPAHSVFSNWTHVIRLRNYAETTSTSGYLGSIGARENSLFL